MNKKTLYCSIFLLSIIILSSCGEGSSNKIESYQELTITGNFDSDSGVLDLSSLPANGDSLSSFQLYSNLIPEDFDELQSQFSDYITVIDNNEDSRTLYINFYRISEDTVEIRIYVDKFDLTNDDGDLGIPVLIRDPSIGGSIYLTFDEDGNRVNLAASNSYDFVTQINWGGGDAATSIKINFPNITLKEEGSVIEHVYSH